MSEITLLQLHEMIDGYHNRKWSPEYILRYGSYAQGMNPTISTPKGYVYFILNKDQNAIKIGYTSSNPKIRLNALQSANVSELYLVGWVSEVDTRFEAMLHKYFDNLRIRAEWFRVSSKIIQVMKEFCIFLNLGEVLAP